jgi:hypothetical protein
LGGGTYALMKEKIILKAKRNKTEQKNLERNKWKIK